MELTDQFITLHEKLRNELDLATLCISKAKTTHGMSLFSVNSVDTHDLEPSVRIDLTEGKFTRIEDSEDEPENDSKSKKVTKKDSGKSEDVEDESKVPSSPFSGQFRPFGVLEPTAAKDARKIYKSVIQTLLDLATTQQSILSKSRELTAN